MPTTLDPQAEVLRAETPRVARVATLVVDVLYVGSSTYAVRAIEASGYGVEHVLTFGDAWQLFKTRTYRLIAAEVDEALVQWLTRMHAQNAVDIPLVLADGADVVSLQPRQVAQEHAGMPLPMVVSQILGGSPRPC